MDYTMTSAETLEVLRDPLGYPATKVHAACAEAADRLEVLSKGMEQLHTYAESKGVDTMAYNIGGPSQEKLKMLRNAAIRHAEQVAHQYFVGCDLGDERIRAGDVYENVRTALRVG